MRWRVKLGDEVNTQPQPSDLNLRVLALQLAVSNLEGTNKANQETTIMFADKFYHWLKQTPEIK